MTRETVRIVADERERQSGIPDELVNLKAVVDFAQLQVGDYIVASDSAVERKSIRDLVQSIYDGRLFTQCSELVTHYAKPVLIVEGSNEMFERVIDNPMVIYGALASVALDFRIAIIHTPSASHTAKALIAMANRALKEKSGPLLRKVKKSNPLKMQQLSILASLPGVGDKLAVRLLTKFKTPLKVLNASTAELSRVEGMGLARATKLRKVLDQVQVDSKNEQTALDGYET
ncbi:MAG: DNA excision repair protein ERCC-4 [Candidatus Nitrosomirales archaeon]|jgi:DNA excision repair protein ERCC-4